MKTKKRKFKWSERQKRALRGSIRKWEGIVAGTIEDEGPANCPCCKNYVGTYDCGQCPISLYVGEPGCLGTPYVDYDCNTKNAKKEAKAELIFLKKVYKAGK